ncbi:MAG TPA: shikimate kinase [Planctomycetota bacterium]|nr:shikimate kinase [Planctomycetota bacterium]HZJ72838.1 shikimate kinase [Planctomycetota bacterium]
MPNVILIGMRASGKSTLGRRLARALGRPFLDLDDELARRSGRSVDALLAERGEAGFRRLEAPVVAWAATRRGSVIATGGGAVLHARPFAALAATGTVLYLQAPAAELARRGEGRLRPALTALSPYDEVAALLRRREILYRTQAAFTIPVSRTDPILALLHVLHEAERSLTC